MVVNRHRMFIDLSFGLIDKFRIPPSSSKFGQTGCTLSGSVRGNVFTGTWHEGTGSGPFEFDMASTQEYVVGWWDTGEDLCVIKTCRCRNHKNLAILSVHE